MVWILRIIRPLFLVVRPSTRTVGIVLLCAAIIGGAFLSLSKSVEASDDPPRILAAASLSGPLSEIRSGQADVQLVFGSSGLLARQIAVGAPADIFISADPQWIDWLISQRSDLADRETRTFTRNRLVLVAPKDRNDGPWKHRPTTLQDALAMLPEDALLSIGDPNHVPAGRYARQALLNAGQWEAFQGRLLHAANVRAALSYVETGSVPAGIVYASDARQSTKVEEIVEIDPGSHDPITYVMLRLSDRPSVIALFEDLSSPETTSLLSRFGFLSAKETPS